MAWYLAVVQNKIMKHEWLINNVTNTGHTEMQFMQHKQFAAHTSRHEIADCIIILLLFWMAIRDEYARWVCISITTIRYALIEYSKRHFNIYTHCVCVFRCQTKKRKNSRAFQLLSCRWLAESTTLKSSIYICIGTMDPYISRGSPRVLLATFLAR